MYTHTGVTDRTIGMSDMITSQIALAKPMKPSGPFSPHTTIVESAKPMKPIGPISPHSANVEPTVMFHIQTGQPWTEQYQIQRLRHRKKTIIFTCKVRNR